jgi:hypothetical protein
MALRPRESNRGSPTARSLDGIVKPDKCGFDINPPAPERVRIAEFVNV